MSRKNKPVRRIVKKLAEIHLASLDLAIDALLKKSSIARVTDKPELDKFINKKFIHDITGIIQDEEGL